MEKRIKMEIALEKMIAQIMKIPRIVIKEEPLEKVENQNLKWILYIVIPNKWKIKHISAICVPEGKIQHLSSERCKYDKCLYYVTLVTYFKEKGKKVIVLMVDFGKRGGVKICKLKTRI